MSEFDDELRRRHSFVEQTAEDTLALFDALSSEHLEAFGDHEAVFRQFMGNIIMPNVRDSVVSVPEEYQGTNALPVLSLLSGEEIKVAPDFYAPTPDQWQGVAESLDLWCPTQTPPTKLLNYFQATAKRRAEIGDTTHLKAGIEFGGVFTNDITYSVGPDSFANLFIDNGSIMVASLVPYQTSFCEDDR